MSSTSSSTTSSSALLWAGAMLGIALSTYSLTHILLATPLQKELESTQKKLKKEIDLRKMERVGRTKAERRLRQEVKLLIKGQTDGGVNLKPIARLQSPFKGRCGTPRQGLLAPNAKGIIRLEPRICKTSLDQLGTFTHLWVVFLFDQNTNYTDALCSESESFTFTAKIAPPRLFGKRVGVFSTRSPHRPNPIGVTVVSIESVDVKKGLIYISGVDMTDGTPILDVKPYIPYDVVLDHRVPDWVVAEDVPHWKLLVEPEAEAALRQLATERQSPFYPNYDALVALLRDVLLQDVRSIHQGRGTTLKEGELEADPVPYCCNIDDIAVEFLTLEEAIVIVRCYEECRDALDPDEERSGKEAGEEDANGALRTRQQQNRQ